MFFNLFGPFASLFICFSLKEKPHIVCVFHMFPSLISLSHHRKNNDTVTVLSKVAFFLEVLLPEGAKVSVSATADPAPREARTVS